MTLLLVVERRLHTKGVLAIQGETLEEEERQGFRVVVTDDRGRFVRSLFAFGCAVVFVGCTTDGGGSMIGNRPLIYKQGPGDEAAQRQSNARPAPSTSSAPSATRVAPSSPSATAAASPVSPGPAPAAAAPPASSAPAPSSAPASSPEPVAATSVPSPIAAAPAAALMPSPSTGTLPPGLTRYTQATRYGDMLFLSGQIGLDARTGAFSPETPVEQQTRQALENVRAILEAHGMTMTNVLSVTLYVANLNTLAAIDGVYASFFKSALPARSVVEVQRLPRAAQMEITVVAGK